MVERARVRYMFIGLTCTRTWAIAFYMVIICARLGSIAPVQRSATGAPSPKDQALVRLAVA